MPIEEPSADLHTDATQKYLEYLGRLKLRTRGYDGRCRCSAGPYAAHRGAADERTSLLCRSPNKFFVGEA
eukprot:5969992-Pleurochrysis_carterae.AAC.6